MVRVECFTHLGVKVNMNPGPEEEWISVNKWEKLVFQGYLQGKASTALPAGCLVPLSGESSPSQGGPPAAPSELVEPCRLMTNHRGSIYQVTQLKFIIKFSIFFLSGPPRLCLTFQTDGAKEFQVLLDDFLVFLGSFSSRLNPVVNHLHFRTSPSP